LNSDFHWKKEYKRLLRKHLMLLRNGTIYECFKSLSTRSGNKD